jgi:hypothetical protein
VRTFSLLCQAVGVICGALCVGSVAMVYLTARDNPDNTWVWWLMIAAMLFITSAVGIALGITFHDPRHRMRRVEHPIAVGRSGASEITDPMPTPARVRRPVSEAYRPEKRTLFRGK